ncbi:MAG: large subunit ribosomal protein [Dehalococcoidia bacterium]|nr:large subunit ribosomal protein [Dehalococcoidia bacterium]
MDTMTIDVFTRDVLGKKVETLRRKGITPLHLYGKGMSSRSLQADGSTLIKLISQVGHHIPVYLKLDGGKERELAFVREIQRHPVTNRILHADFYRVDVRQSIKGEVPITLVGEAPAVQVHRGTLIQNLHRISVECLPMDMPERIEVDISILVELNQSLRVSDLTLGPGITITSDLEEVIVRVSPPRAELPTAERPGTVQEEQEKQ